MAIPDGRSGDKKKTWKEFTDRTLSEISLSKEGIF
jgi:hypothetical protein